jgi:hypothetical protein
MLMCCVYAFSLHRESPDTILGDKRLISEVVLSQGRGGVDQVVLTVGRHGPGGGDDREDSAAPRRGGDDWEDGAVPRRGGDRRAAWTRRQ